MYTIQVVHGIMHQVIKGKGDLKHIKTMWQYMYIEQYDRKKFDS